MSSEILPAGETPVAAAALWRVVEPPADFRNAGGGREDAEREAHALEQARREGFAAGVAAGRRETEEQVRPAMDGLARNLAEVARLRDTIREEATHDLVRLAVSIAARVMHREVSLDPDALTGLVRTAFLKLQAREIQRVRMHPGLEPLVRKSMEQAGSPKNLVLAADSALKPGELFLETPQGILDASVDTQLREIERGLIDRLER
ncbi:MAG TPA: FliH/SctL family protein [Bryobacteraceae bacterium]|nr:FliH/SctL family protein [Bryobacteraceae bacterium]